MRIHGCQARGAARDGLAGCWGGRCEEGRGAAGGEGEIVGFDERVGAEGAAGEGLAGGAVAAVCYEGWGGEGVC